MSPNPFSGSDDCTQVLSGTAAEGEAACTGGRLGMPVPGTFYPAAACDLYAAESFGGLCYSTAGELEIANVLEVVEDSAMQDCVGLQTVCSTFVRGTFEAAPACGGDAAAPDGLPGMNATANASMAMLNATTDLR